MHILSCLLLVMWLQTGHGTSVCHMFLIFERDMKNNSIYLVALLWGWKAFRRWKTSSAWPTVNAWQTLALIMIIVIGITAVNPREVPLPSSSSCSFLSSFRPSLLSFFPHSWLFLFFTTRFHNISNYRSTVHPWSLHENSFIFRIAFQFSIMWT